MSEPNHYVVQYKRTGESVQRVDYFTYEPDPNRALRKWLKNHRRAIKPLSAIAIERGKNGDGR